MKYKNQLKGIGIILLTFLLLKITTPNTNEEVIIRMIGIGFLWVMGIFNIMKTNDLKEE